MDISPSPPRQANQEQDRRLSPPAPEPPKLTENNSTATSTAGVTKRVSNLPIRQQLSAARSILNRSPSTVHPSPPTNSEKLDQQHPSQTPPRSQSFFHPPWSLNSATVAPAQDVAGRTPLPPSRPLPRFGLPISPKKIVKAINNTFDRRSSPVHPAPSPQPPGSPEITPHSPPAAGPASGVTGSSGAPSSVEGTPPIRAISEEEWKAMTHSQQKRWSQRTKKQHINK